jgi:transposase
MALRPKQRGRPVRRDPVAAENEELRKENQQLKERLRKAELIIEVQKKISQMMGIPEGTEKEEDN